HLAADRGGAANAVGVRLAVEPAQLLAARCSRARAEQDAQAEGEQKPWPRAGCQIKDMVDHRVILPKSVWGCQSGNPRATARAIALYAGCGLVAPSMWVELA